MSSTPVDEHTEEFEQLAGLCALGVLEGDELARFEQHAASCERCQVMVRLDREALALAAPEMEPSPDFKARLMQRAAQELAATEVQGPVEPVERQPQREPIPARQPGPEPMPPRSAPNVIPFWRRSPWASALAAVVVVGLVVGGGYSYENQVVASYALSGNAPGQAVVVVRRSGAAELDLSGVPNPPAGFLYEAWIIPPDGRPIPAGVTSTGQASLPLSGLSNGAKVAITEEHSRVDAPTSAPILAVMVD